MLPGDLLGVRVLHAVSDKVSLAGYDDVGAGGSDLTYQFLAGAYWAFSKGYTAKLGYRLLYWDYENDCDVWDMTASGPYLGWASLSEALKAPATLV